jgi:hypothetical protein
MNSVLDFLKVCIYLLNQNLCLQFLILERLKNNNSNRSLFVKQSGDGSVVAEMKRGLWLDRTL